MNEDKLGLFNGEDMPDVETVWDFYEEGQRFNQQINLLDTVKVNENFFIGKQWEGVQANGLPTPVFNQMKRIVGFHVATITTDNLKVNATALANSANTDSFQELVRVVNEELEAIMEHDSIPSKIRMFAQDAAVKGDGCIFAYWDPTADMGGGVVGRIRHEVMENTRVFFGNPNVREVQRQPYIQIISRNICREVRIAAKEHGSADWDAIQPDNYEEDLNDAVQTDDKVTVILTLWRSEEDGTIWAYESTNNVEIRKPWSLGIRRYPLVWMNWDEVTDCYHGESMITGLIPNQIFINKAFAMSMLSIMRTAWPKVIYDSSRVKKWDNRVGGAIPAMGDVNSVAKILDPAAINPQVAEYITMAINETKEALGATQAALGEGKAYNTSAILSLQKAAATPTEMTKQRLYKAVEDLFYIDLEFMGEYYGVRKVDMPTPNELKEAYALIGRDAPEEVPLDFDFSVIKENPMLLKLDVGASSYYSEIASLQTLDKLLEAGQINIVQYLERIPDSYVPGRHKLIAEKRQELEAMQAQQAMMSGLPPDMAAGGGMEPPQAGVGQPATPNDGGPILGNLQTEPEITGGRGYNKAARAINGQA